MPFTLDKWNIFIQTILNPANGTLLSLEDEAIELLIKQSKDEEDRVRALFLERMLQRKKVKDKHQFVKLTQAVLIRLIDKLSSYRKTKDLNIKVLKLYDAVSTHLESMLNFIADFFPNYFDRNEKVPACYLEVSIHELRRQVKVLEECIQLHAPYINAIVNILTTNFKKFCKEKKDTATYNELIYQKELVKHLLTDDTLSAENSINEVLFYFNYNDDEYVAYLYEKFVLLTQSLDTTKEKISALRYELKKCNQLPAKLNCFLSANMPSLKEQVNLWIQEEIKFLETDSLPELAVVKDNESEDKIHTSISVTRLAILIKLMVADKIITNRVVTHVLRLTVKTFSTQQKENIAPGSLETKYHNPDRGSISAVKDMLFRWINILNDL